MITFAMERGVLGTMQHSAGHTCSIGNKGSLQQLCSTAPLRRTQHVKRGFTPCQASMGIGFQPGVIAELISRPGEVTDSHSQVSVWAVDKANGGNGHHRSRCSAAYWATRPGTQQSGPFLYYEAWLVTPLLMCLTRLLRAVCIRLGRIFSEIWPQSAAAC